MDNRTQQALARSRVNIALDVLKGSANPKGEIPFKMLAVGDYTGRDEPIKDPIAVTSHTFDAVMKDQNLELDLIVPDKASDSGEEMKVSLKFDSINAMRPESVARQVPRISQLLATRNLLDDLKNRLKSKKDFRDELNEILKDEKAFAEFSQRIDGLIEAAETPPD